MRELLFRGLDVKTKKWVYGGVTSFNHSPESANQIISNRFYEGNEEDEHYIIIDVIPESIGQYVGLSDKSEIKIFEGDLVRRFESEVFGVVKYFACSFMVEWVGQDCYSDLLGWYNFKRGAASKPEDYEIIGNLYQHPELLSTPTQ